MVAGVVRAAVMSWESPLNGCWCLFLSASFSSNNSSRKWKVVYWGSAHSASSK